MIWRTIPLSNTAESNWASVAGLVPIVELKGFRTPQHTAMDEVGRGSTGLAVGIGRRKYKCSYPRPQADEEDNVDHGARQRSTEYEETASITHSFVDIEEGAPSSNRTTPGAGCRGHCTGRRCK
jgi:hypothetical protein